MVQNAKLKVVLMILAVSNDNTINRPVQLFLTKGYINSIHSAAVYILKTDNNRNNKATKPYF